MVVSLHFLLWVLSTLSDVILNFGTFKEQLTRDFVLDEMMFTLLSIYLNTAKIIITNNQI